MENIELKELKGVTVKLIAVIVFFCISTTGSVMGTYYGLIGHMDANKVELKERIDDEKHFRQLDELQIKEMRIRLDALEVKVDQMRTKTQ